MKKGRCTVCTKKCPASDHVKEKKKYVIKTRKVKKTIGELKQNNEADKEQNDNLLSKFRKEQEKLEEEKDQLLDEAYQHVVELEKIAVNVNSLFTHVHLDLLIKIMEDKKDTEKVENLKKMKSRVDPGILAALQGGLKVAGKLTASAKAAGKGFKS